MPSGAEPGAEASRFQKQTEQQKERTEKKKVKGAPIEVEEKPQKPTGEKVSFVLKGINVTGATIFKPEVFSPIFKPYLDKKITFDDLQGIAEKIKEKYKEKGYLTTTVFIPSQSVETGVVEIRIVEGKMGALKIEGNKYFSSSLLAKYFHIKKNETLNILTAQRDIYRLNRSSDLEVKAVIAAGEEPQTSDIILKVAEKFPWHVGFTADDMGTRLTGKNRGGFYLRSSNLSGNLDSIFISSSFSFLTSGQSISYTLPLNTYGTNFNLDMTYFKMKEGKEFKPFVITGLSRYLTPHISQELFLSADSQGYVDTGIEVKSIKKKVLGNVSAKDELRLPYFGFNLSNTDSWGGQNSFAPRFVFGTGRFMGSSIRNHPSAGRSGADGFFLKYEQGLNRTQSLMWDSYLAMRSDIQFASRTLPSAEQMQLGGAYSVRGYPEGDYLSDYGANVNFDWVFPNYLIPASWKMKGSQVPLRHQIEPVLFFDVGGGGLKKVEPGEIKHKFLAGVGGGLRFRFNKVFLRLDLAKHIGDKPTGNSGPATLSFTFQSEM